MQTNKGNAKTLHTYAYYAWFAHFHVFILQVELYVALHVAPQTRPRHSNKIMQDRHCRQCKMHY